ncbi:MAG TPA: site-specific integrase [Acidimicrobiales bacterium]|nr:site-specific integrase [Acidimicrobiales bacterium]
MPRGRKLGYGEGSVYFDKSKGVWRGAITVDGRRRRVSGLTKSEAQAALGMLRDTVNSGLPADGTTLGEWVGWWLDHVGSPKQDSGEATRENYRWALEQTSAIWSIRLADLKAADVNRMLGHLATRRPSKPGSRGGRRGRLGGSALRRVRFALSVVLDAALADGRMAVNVAQPKLAVIPRTAQQVRPRRSLTPEEAQSLLAAAEGHRLEALVGVMLYCGLRPGETTGLTWDCVDLKKETLAIRQSRKVAPGGTMTMGGTKANSDRTIRIPAPVVELLRRHQYDQKAARLAAPAWEHSELIFTNSVGDYIDPSNLRREVAALCKDAGVFPAISPNDLRHSCASLLRHLGLPLAQIADFLGHRDTRILDKHYGHPVTPVLDLTDAQARMLGTL